jgi:hypothetical protein
MKKIEITKLKKVLPSRRNVMLGALLVFIWVTIFFLFSALPGDLFYFPKLLIVNARLSPEQKIDSLWQGYVRHQKSGNCKKSLLVEQELLKEMAIMVAQNKQGLLEQVKQWQDPMQLSCVTTLPFAELRILASVAEYGTASKELALTDKVEALKADSGELIELSRHTGFKSQRALNSFTELALGIGEYADKLLHSNDPLSVYEFELRVITMRNILERGETISSNYQQLFLAACILSPEYEVCQNADKFNAKWNSVASAGTPEKQLQVGRGLLNEILFYQGLLTDN